MSKQVWVFSDMPGRYPELLAGAATLGGNVSAFVVGDGPEAAAVFSHGARTVYRIGRQDGHILEDYAASMAQAIRQSGQPALVLLAATKRGKAMAARLGVALDAAIVNEAADILVENESVQVRHMVYGGLAHGLEKIASASVVITVGSGVFEAGPGGAAQGDIVDVAFTPPARSVKCLETRPKQSSSVDIGKAKRVVAIGRGMASKDDIPMMQALATALDAELGCSRPIAEGENWMERERYVGVSGVMLKADLYFAVGISGQIQHMVGANSSKVIVAVNKDKSAPIFQSADYGLVGDLYKVVPALTAALKV